MNKQAMTQSTIFFCPYLGLAGHRTLVRTTPDASHRCFARTPPASLDEAHQRTFCRTAAYRDCPFYREPEADSPAVEMTALSGNRVPWSRMALIAVPLILLAVVAFVYGRDLLRPRAIAQTPAPMPSALPSGTETPAATLVAVAAPTEGSAASNPKSAIPEGQAVGNLTTPTAVPGGRVLTIAPKAGAAGWWTSDKTLGNLGDSYLYAGHYGGQTFLSAVQLDLRQVPRGASVEDAKLHLTGLVADRFNGAAGGNWLVQLLPADTIPDLARADFQALFNAPVAVTLLPTLYPADLGPNQVNTLSVGEAGRNWLEKQIASGQANLIVRITGPAGGADTLFAWDGGAGPATAGEGPQLLLSLGAAPPTPPPLPTEAVIIATLTPTPANALTAAADALAATYVATTVGTATPLLYRVVTPTPLPANLATAQALGVEEAFVPIVIYSPTPANGATATADARYATAVALTTGTFTPVPDNAVTPVIVLPTPFPENVVTAAAQMLAATAQTEKVGTVTPLPTGALIATVTATRPMVWATETPADYATAAARVAYATAVAITTGTFTPIPRNAVTPTALPRATLLPLLVPITPVPTPTFTSTPPASLPGALAGKVLFYSDRDGSTRLYAMEPATRHLSWVTQDWPFALAQAGLGRSPDGRYSAEVQILTEVTQTDPMTGAPSETRSNAVIFIRSNEYHETRELTTHDRFSYDPAWSPAGDQIAFVSRDGSDEIYVINADGSNLRRLTSNTWEWDKHPSWSPDGKQIVFWSNRVTGRRQLWVMNADGSDQRPFMNSPYNDWDPIWVN